MYSKEGIENFEKNLEEDKEKLVEFLAGDINLNYSEEGKCAEVNIMIAEEGFRRKGISTQIMKFLMENGRSVLGGEKMEVIKAIIGNENLASISFFEKLGFVKGKEIEGFNQTEFIYRIAKNEE